MPEVVPAGDWRFPVPHESRLGNGVRLLALDAPGQHVVTVAVVFDVPIRVEPRASEGLVGLVAECLTRGAGDLSADDLADAFAACGADIDAAGSTDAMGVRVTVPVTRLERALDLLAQVLAHPRFDEREVAQQRRLRLEEIDLGRAYPTVVVGERLNAALFGDQRLGRPLGGTRETVSGIEREQVVGFAREWLRPANATVIVVGDGMPGVAPRLLDASLGRWLAPGAPNTVPTGGAVAVADTPSILLVDWPDAAQAVVRVAGPGITRNDARWPAMFVANYIIGGSFGSRLNTVLREQRGLTYGIGSGLDSSRHAGVFAVGASVEPDAVAEVVSEVVAIVSNADGTLTEDEVADAARAAVDSAPLTYERADAVAGRVEMLLTHGLPLDHVDTNLARIRAVTADDANAALRSTIDAAGFTVVVAADARSAEEPLRALGHGPVTVVPRPT